MGCCGKAIQKGRNIAVGYTNLLRGRKYEFTDDRVRACHNCPYQTWMSHKEYAAWLARNGLKILRHFTELEKLPLLPKYERGPKRRCLYCRICKCFVPAKARVKEKICPDGRWEK
jgi:hypothetical protein